MTDVVLGKNQYGKAENHVVRIHRDTDRHVIRDLVVTSQLRGDFEAVHTQGDNAHCVPTDTQKNTVFAFVQKYGVDSPEALLLKLSEHFTSEFEWVSGGRWAADEHAWDRINDNDHCFVQNKQEVRTAVVVTDGPRSTVISGFKDLTVLKSTESGFQGYPKDQYTTLPETTDRIMSTDVATRWRYSTTDVDFDAVYEDVKKIILDKFTDHYSRALQETLYLMGKAVIEAHPEIDEIKFSCPNKHHFVYDLGFCDLPNDNETHYAADRPFGLIEATVQRKDAQPDENAWVGIAGFC
ncbi:MULTISPECIES: factor-independent urate hydroxylase [Kocuria]|uniref:Uricase n=1 Tax=Kocuria rhizophila (strain ATCC 9341 / DSM 348 / NBRC 103217 / DC2201) TaxID=378753 RepID=B2GGK9_KOCRD|nr:MULTISPECIES: urate oxidase [Kocuria]HBH56483.1 urate oxidase [Kocuria sp.]ASE11929.1 urate oxidase [Kocuria rhizophila]MCC5673672.1 urate oxidase [Kocuria rhizophila]WTI32204.1 urate oxidase [Kocuria rhizophila]VEH74409.1 Uricase [Kocuria rhizophila]